MSKRKPRRAVRRVTTDLRSPASLVRQWHKAAGEFDRLGAERSGGSEAAMAAMLRLCAEELSQVLRNRSGYERRRQWRQDGAA